MLSKQIAEMRRSIGSEVYQAMMRHVGGTAVYMGDNVENYIEQGYIFNPHVYSIVSFLAQKASAIPWYVYQVKDEKSLSLYKSSSPQLGYKRQIVRTKAMVEVEDHELSGLFLRPNPLQSWSELCEQAVGFLLITGDSYLHAIGPTNGLNAGLLKEMWGLPSQVMRILPGDRTRPVRGYIYQPDSSVVIPLEEMIHLKYWTPEYASGAFLYGMSPIRAGRRVVTKSNASYDSSVASFQNMGAYGMITAGDTSKDSEPFTEEQAEMVRKRYGKLTGPKNAGKPLITSANLKWQQIGMSPADLQVIESDKMDMRTLCNIFHVPSELFNDASNKTYSNTKEAGSAVYTNAVIPALSKMRDGINAFIYPKYQGKFYVDFDTSMISELQEDIQYLSTALSQCWWVTGNERREIMGFGQDESNPMLDDYLVPAGLLPMMGMGIPDNLLDENE